MESSISGIMSEFGAFQISLLDERCLAYISEKQTFTGCGRKLRTLAEGTVDSNTNMRKVTNQANIEGMLACFLMLQ